MPQHIRTTYWLAALAFALVTSLQGTATTCGPEGAPCDDGNACTTADTCRAGTCSGSRVSCNDGNPCNGVETCAPTRGCVAGEAPVCNDADPCTADRCDFGVGCRSTPAPDMAACRARRLVQFITDTPAADVGGLQRHQRLLRRATAAARKLERAAMVPAPRAERLHRKAKRDLVTLNRLGRKGLQRGEIVPTLANQMLALVGQAARAASGR